MSKETKKESKKESKKTKKQRDTVIHIHSCEEFNKIVEEAKGKPLFLKCSTKWCGPCKTIQPTFEKLSSEFPGIIFIGIDIEENDLNELSDRFNIDRLPTFVFLEEDKDPKIRVTSSANDLEKWLLSCTTS